MSTETAIDTIDFKKELKKQTNAWLRVMDQRDELGRALKLLADRKCGSGCVLPKDDKSTEPRYAKVEDRCAFCIAADALRKMPDKVRKLLGIK